MDNPIRRSAAPVSEGDLALFESTTGLTLPAEYRAFLLASNGGVPQRTRFLHRNKKGQARETWVRYFYPLGREGLIDPDWNDLQTAFVDRPRGLPREVLPVAQAYFHGNEGFVCVACGGPDAGKVSFRPEVEPEKTTLHEVEASWAAFLVKMTFEDGKPKAWKLAIENQDLPALREWLETKKKKWREDRSLSIDVERAAVEEDHWPTILTLIEFGFEIDSLFEEALSYNRYDLALQLLKTGDVSRDAVEECLVGAEPFLWHLPPLLEELVAAGADVNQEDDSGQVPLHKAVESLAEVGVRFLIEKGADPTVKDDDGRTPRKLALRLEETKLAAILKDAEDEWAKRPAVAEETVVAFDFKGVEIRNAGPILTLADVLTFEEKVGLKFPPEYRGFLLATNGGKPVPNTLSIRPQSEDEEDEDEGDDDNPYGGEGTEPRVTFLPLRKEDSAAVPIADAEGAGYTRSAEEAREWYHDGTDIPRGTIPIGWLDDWGEGAWLLLGCKGRDRGKLSACYYGVEKLDLTLPALFDLLAQSKARPKTPGERLADAVDARDLEGVKAALAAGAVDVWSTRDGRIPLRTCVEKGFDAAVLAMADAGWGLTQLLQEAANFDRHDLLARLSSRITTVKKKQADELLVFPTTYADAELLKKIAASGINLARKTKWGFSYIFSAAASGSVLGVAYMLDAGCDPNDRTEDGGTPLHHAASAKAGDAAGVIRLLLARGAKANQPSSQGETALHWAARAGNLEAAKVLIDAGEDLHAKHELFPAGMSPERAAKLAQQSAKMFEQMGSMFGDLGMDDEDGPPLPDTSHPTGEKAANLIEQMQKAMEAMRGRVLPGLGEKMAERAAGSWGQGESAAAAASNTEEGQRILAELETYAAAKRG